jgi:hypothetical protein
MTLGIKDNLRVSINKAQHNNTMTLYQHCHYAECSNADCHVIVIVMMIVVMLSVVADMNLQHNDFSGF